MNDQSLIFVRGGTGTAAKYNGGDAPKGDASSTSGMDYETEGITLGGSLGSEAGRIF